MDPDRFDPHDLAEGKETSVEVILCFFSRHGSFQKISEVSYISSRWALNFQFVVNLCEIKVGQPSPPRNGNLSVHQHQILIIIALILFQKGIDKPSLLL